MTSFISVQELNVIIHQFSQYIKINIYLSETNCTVIIIWKIHIVKNLKTKMFIEMNILVSEDIIMNLSYKIAVIGSCQNIEISLTIIIKSTNQINHIILFKQCTVVSSHSNLAVKIFHLDLSQNQDFLFKSNCCHVNAAVYAHIVDYIIMKIYV